MIAFTSNPPFVPLWQLDGGCIGPFWEFYSLKAGRVVRLRGNLLYYFWVLLESDPSFTQLCEHPIRIEIRIRGRWVKAEFEVWARDRAGIEYFFTVKYLKNLHGPEAKASAQRSMDACEMWAAENGVRYAVATDKMTWREPRLLSNWSFLLRFLNDNYRESDLELGARIRRAVEATGTTSVADIRAMFTECDATTVDIALFRQIHAGHLRANLSEGRLGGRTAIFTP
jgi:hypothetical protein